MTPDVPHWPPPPRRRVFLMRHGEVAYFDADGLPVHPDGVLLTREGLAQSQAVRDFLADVPLDLAIHSGLPRTRQTAAVILDGRAVPTEEDGRFREIITGKMAVGADPRDILRTVLGGFGPGLTPETGFLEGESFADCLRRVLTAWDALLTRTDWTNALVVAHGVVNRLVLAHLLGAPLDALASLEQDPCGVNLVEVGHGPPLLRFVNHTPADSAKSQHRLTTLESLIASFLAKRGGSP